MTHEVTLATLGPPFPVQKRSTTPCSRDLVTQDTCVLDNQPYFLTGTRPTAELSWGHSHSQQHLHTTLQPKSSVPPRRGCLGRAACDPKPLTTPCSLL